MQTGPSRELFELWAPDSRNGLIITGYSVEGTLARVSSGQFCTIWCPLLYVYETMDIFSMTNIVRVACMNFPPLS
jgi:Cft2 family RNA processing exonuclease